MSATKIFTKCCKPLGSGKCSRGLRNVVPWMIKKNSSLNVNQKICDTCRTKLNLMNDCDNLPELPNLDECMVDIGVYDNNFESEDETDNAKRIKRDPPYISEETAINLLNNFLLEVGEPLIDSKRLLQKNYCKAKVASISNVLKSTIFRGYPSDSEKTSEDSGTVVLEQLKEKFRSSSSRSEKTCILTLVPQKWSILKTKSEFEGASEHMIRISKKLVAEKGILSSPNVKCGHPLSSNTETLIKEFYLNDEYSRQMPGQKDFVSIRTPNGRVHEQKRLLLNNLKELHASFKVQNSTVKVSFSKFAMLRPKNCVLAGASGTHSVCVCQLHQNPKLMLAACDWKSMHSTDVEKNLSDYQILLKMMICEIPTERCYLRMCSSCPGSDVLRNILSGLFDENNIETITYKQWTSTDRSTLETLIKSVEEYLDTLIESLEKLLSHSFTAKQQSQYINHLKETILPEVFLTLMDYSENYSFMVQDAVQGFHWNNSQATIHPFVFYFKDENKKLQNGNFVIISNCLKHDATAVNLFIKHYLRFLRSHYKLSKAIYFSDGCGGQYKNKNNFINLTYHQSDFNLEAEWHFFATSHGKSASDGIGGTLKRLAAKASLQRPINDQILTPKQLYEWAKSSISGINVHYVSQDEYDEHVKLMEPRFIEAKTLKGTRKQHAIFPVEPGVLKAKFYSFSDKCVQHKIV